MKIHQKIRGVIESAECKALATCGVHGINVVPVSMVRVNDDTVWLFNFFMDKSVTNLKTDNSISLACWTEMTGVQIKATVEYVENGEKFDEAVAWAKTQNPNRIVRGLLILSPTSIHDISPGGKYTKEELAIN